MGDPLTFDPTPDIDGMADGRVTPPVEHQAYALLRRIITDHREFGSFVGLGSDGTLMIDVELNVSPAEAALLARLAGDDTKENPNG